MPTDTTATNAANAIAAKGAAKNSPPKTASSAPPASPLAFAALALGVLLPALGTSSANVALPQLATAFVVSFQAAQWIVLAYLLAITTLVVVAGRLGDIVGRRRLLLAGTAVFTAASAACAAAPSFELLIAARALQGAGAAVMMALSMAAASTAVPKERTGAAMGWLGTMSAVGTACGPTLGGALIAAWDWPAIFAVNVPLGLIALVLAWRTLPPDSSIEPLRAARFDTAGAVLLTLTLAAYALALTVGRGRFGWTNGALLAAAIGGLGLFLRVEANAAVPLVRLALFRDPRFAGGLATSALVATILMATLVVGPFHLSRALGLDIATIGLVMSIGPAVAALTGAPAGRLVDRIGARRATSLGLCGIGVGSFALALAPLGFGIPGYLGPIVVLTASYALFQAANTAGVMTGVPLDSRGVASGLLNLSRNLGLVTGTAAMGAVFALAAGTAEIATAAPAAVGGGTRATFVVAGLLALFGLAIALRRPDGRAMQPEEPAQR